MLRAIVPEAVIDPLTDQLQRRLRSERVLGGHVEVVHEGQQRFSADRHEGAFRSFLDARLDDVLDVAGGRLRGHVDGEDAPLVGIQIADRCLRD